MEIEPPNKYEPAQVICLVLKVRDLVTLLSQAENIPQLEIHLKNSRFDDWSFHGQPNQSIKSHDTLNIYHAKNDILDYYAVLQPFYRLDNVSLASIHIEGDLNGARPFIETVAKIIMEGQCTPAMERDIDTAYLNFDAVLDSIGTWTGSMLRMERFATWLEDGLGSRSPYLEEMERIHSTGIDVSPNNVFAIEFRYRMTFAFNPMSAKMQMLRHGISLCPLCRSMVEKSRQRRCPSSKTSGTGASGATISITRSLVLARLA